MNGQAELFTPPDPAERRPRHYQKKAIEITDEELRQYRSILHTAATGTGKTFIGAEIIKRRIKRGRQCWINERDTLVRQAVKSLQRDTGYDAYLEQAGSRAPQSSRLVVASIDSLSQPRRLESFPRDFFSDLYIDEAHHARAERYIRAVAYFSNAKIIGFTGTPNRHDGKSLAPVFEREGIKYLLPDGVLDGYLVGYTIKQAPVDAFDLRKIKKSKQDFSDDEVANIMGPEVVRGIIDKLFETVGDKRTVVFMPRVDIAHHAERACNLIRPGWSRAIDGEMDPREKAMILEEHRAGKFPYVWNCDVIGEGYDDPGIEVVGLGSQTNSKPKIVQRCGRATRPLVNVDAYETAEERIAAIASSTKPHAIVLDFVSNIGEHTLASPVDAMAGDDDTEETIKAAKAILTKARGGDVMEALEIARRLQGAERQREAERIARVQGVKWEWRTIDPFKGFGMQGPTEVAEFDIPASEKQKYFLRRNGMNPPEQLTSRDAQRLIGTVKLREKKGLADFGLIQLLSRHGYSATNMYRGTAERIRELIRVKRGWDPSPAEVQAIIDQGRKVGEDDGT